jgi:hypothetical protein
MPTDEFNNSAFIKIWASLLFLLIKKLKRNASAVGGEYLAGVNTFGKAGNTDFVNIFAFGFGYLTAQYIVYSYLFKTQICLGIPKQYFALRSSPGKNALSGAVNGAGVQYYQVEHN